MSSANSQVPNSDARGMSLMNIKNSNGPRTLPWGTPHSIRSSADTLSSMRVNCFRFVR